MGRRIRPRRDPGPGYRTSMDRSGGGDGFIYARSLWNGRAYVYVYLDLYLHRADRGSQKPCPILRSRALQQQP